MKRFFLLAIVLVFVVVAAFFALRMPKAKAVPAGPPGTWMVGGGGDSSYLVNTTTGEAWLLQGDSKRLVTDVPASPRQ